ncbi:extracelular serine carboxypeptidase [Purpureocillium lavendulum]|uniref:Extracelular serine carboxypeptidase n=1 Tax=Purpureocillium lavendulum TaxID=1247861 RepID=A0AB34FHH2_9HYPO|nr:extracelular serine carboxypeptidase [Purpureocillium lavendulum]
MMLRSIAALAALAALSAVVPAAALQAPGLLRHAPVPSTNPQTGQSQTAAELVGAGSTGSRIKAYNLSVPVDHFHNESRYEPHTDAFFNLRYWVDITHYKPGGPVIVLNSGETSGEARIDFLDHGIVPILTKATGGVGVVLEHRYYGTSFPTANVTTQSLRFLSTEQALADHAYFARHARFPGLEHVNLTAPGTPWIIYGGSYAGALAAFTRKVYPDVYWGAISSSGVTEAIDVFWQYFEAARRYAPGECAPTQQKIMHVVDTMLLSGDKAKEDEIKDLFGLKDLWNDEFASFLAGGVYGLQSTNWDPAQDDPSFGTWCATISTDALLFQSTAHLRPDVERAVRLAGYKDDGEQRSLTTRMLNYIGFVLDAGRKARGRCGKKTLRECLSNRFFEDDTSVSGDENRSWLYQTCTEWGYFTAGDATPKNKLAMISRAFTYEYSTIMCRSLFNITKHPDVGVVNKYGGFNFSYPRVALINGAQDPWRSCTGHAIGRPGRESTTEEPFMLIDWAVHHWDENGLSDPSQARPGFPPKQIADAQSEEVRFVKAWLKDFDRKRKRAPGMMGVGEL